MLKPSPDKYPAYFQKYIDQVTEEELFTAFRNQLPQAKALLDSISEEKSMHSYGPGKWTIKEVLQHLIDAERIFNYRALCFARGDKTSLPSFEENDYADNSNANSRPWQDMVDEFFAVRHTTEQLFRSFTPEALETTGTANNNLTSTGSMGFITLGHFNHHKKVLEERYL